MYSPYPAPPSLYSLLLAALPAHRCLLPSPRPISARSPLPTHRLSRSCGQVEPTQRGKTEIDPTHIFNRVAFELILTEDDQGGYRPRGPIALSEIRVGRGPYLLDTIFEKKLVPAAELMLDTLKAEEEGFVTVELKMPEVGCTPP